MNQRGVAMLIVLATAVMLLAAASIIARSRATAALSQRTDERLRLAWAACEAAEAPILAWLERRSRRVVLAPDAPPVVTVLDDTILIGELEARIHVTAWDQTAMIPAVDLAKLPALSALLSRDDRAAARWMDTDRGSPGLDIGHPSVAIFPAPDGPGALGARVATHNPPPGPARQRGGQLPAININTAPEPLLRAVYEQLDISGLHAVLQARRAGERAEINQQRGSNAQPIRLVGSSTAWGIRTDVSINGLRASIWSVYTLRAGTWTREQRLVIAE
jgi:hypothetical protein